ncbi:Integrase family protein [uncultured Desulfatiglans sp.]|nr:Integrase family protein [uncultured Desulfatiglans sp.]
MAKWIASRFPGVRYREHASRKHGVTFDKYITIYYKLDGKMVQEVCGWTSKGWTEKKAAAILAELQENQRRGEGPRTLRAKRALEEKAREDQQARDNEAELRALTFGQFWKETYAPAARQMKRAYTFEKEASHFKFWLEPAIGDRPLCELAPLDVRRVRSKLQKARRSGRTIQYVLSSLRVAWNFARREKLVSGDWPGKGERLPRFDNQRARFLSQGEAVKLLDALREKSVTVHDQALLSLHCGLRFSELARLTWSCIDFEQRTIFIKDAKSGRNRHVPMTNEVYAALKARYSDETGDTMLWPDAKTGAAQKQVSRTFTRAIKKLGFNDGINDPRQKVCFHSLRHSYCSWLVQAGTPLYTVAKLAGHQTLTMATRYSHLAPDTLRGAVAALNGTLTPKTKAEVIKMHE